MACTPTNSFNDFTGNGSTTQFTITFQYLIPSDIKARSGAEPPYTDIPSTDFSVSGANPQVVVFNTAPSGPFRIYRCTTDADINATFQAGSAIRAADLNDNFEQLLYLSQEARAGAAGDFSDVLAELDTKVDTVTATAPITGSIADTTLTVGINAATTSAAGSMSSDDKTKLDGVSGTAPIVATSTADSLTVSIDAATAQDSGSMSATDKAKLDSIVLTSTAAATFSENIDGSRTQFTFAGGATANSVWDITISLNGVIQQPSVDYTFSNGTVTFATAPSVTSTYWVVIKGIRSSTGIF